MLSLAEKQIYILATSFMAGFFVAAMVRLWLLRRVEERLLKNKDALEKQIVLQQKDLLTVRQESNAWRVEMQRQFDLFRHMASDQLGVEERRFNDLLTQSTRREYELQTALALAKDMCIELPSAKARILHLESLLGSPRPPASGNDGGLPAPVAPVSPMPDLGGPEVAASLPVPETPELESPIAPAPDISEALPALDDGKLAALEQKLAEAERKNISLQQTLAATRLRLRPRANALRKARSKQQA